LSSRDEECVGSVQGEETKLARRPHQSAEQWNLWRATAYDAWDPDVSASPRCTVRPEGNWAARVKSVNGPR
jgi:hypothetical protein